MDELAKIYHRGTCKKSDQLFIPCLSSQTSVIKHTNDLKRGPEHSSKGIEKLDSGIDSWDDEEERLSSSPTRIEKESNVSPSLATVEKGTSKERHHITKLSLEKLVDVDVEKLHSAVSPVSFPFFVKSKNESTNFHYHSGNYDSHELASSNTDSRKPSDLDAANVDLSYLFHLYEQAEPGHLKNTILKLISNVSNEQCKKLNQVHDSLKERRNRAFSLNDLQIEKTSKNLPSTESLDLVLPPLIPARAVKRSYSQSSADIDVHVKSPTIYPSPTEKQYSAADYMRSYSSLLTLANNYETMFAKKFSDKPNSDKSFHCEYCHKCFNHKNAWQRHLLTHKGKRTHKCTQCSRSFYEQSAYLRHLQSHNGEKAHKCEQCSMAFSKRSALEVHIRTHTGERPYKCKFCGKGFSISGNLHRHILIHTGHRPYKCGKCPRAFNNPSHLARHISSFHT